MSGKANDNSKDEQRRKKFTRIKETTSIYVFKGLVFMGLATLAILKAETVNALLLGALTYAVGIIFDMWILSKDNSTPVTFWISVFQWFVTFIVIGFTIGDFVLLVSYEDLFVMDCLKRQELTMRINFWIPVFMYGIGIVSSSAEVYYSLPEDD